MKIRDTVEAGIRVAELQRVLAEKGQTFPVDCPFPAEATLGGLLATNTSGPRRLGHGTARDYVLGLDVVDAAGRRIHGGGRVVKNVAGYDLPKLHIGALGTLGIVVEATLKVKPLPEANASVAVVVAANVLADCLAAARASTLRPTAVVVGGHGELFRAEAHFEDVPDAVEYQCGKLREKWAGFGEITATRTGNGWLATNEELAVKVVAKPSAFAELWSASAGLGVLIDRCGFAGSGIIWCRAPRLLSTGEALMEMRNAAEKLGGSLVVAGIPAHLQIVVRPWGSPRPDWALMDRIRTTLDPQRRINPGRFVVD